MKIRFFMLVLALSSLVVFTGCGKKENDKNVPDTDGGKLQQIFLDELENNPDISSQDLADTIIQNEIIPFEGATMPVEEGWLAGFDNEITGFRDGVMFSPMIGTIPFVGYVFETDDPEGLLSFLKEKANMAWNICTQADETVSAIKGNLVFFMMCSNEN